MKQLKKPEEYIDKINLYVLERQSGQTESAMIEDDVIELIEQVQKDALEVAAENARTKMVIPVEDGCRMYTDSYEIVDKDSILNLITKQ